MAEPSGPRKNKNGKKQYSQTSNAIRHRKRLKLGEFADDYVAAAATAPTQPHSPQESVSSPEGYSTETIGVVSTIEEVPELTPHLDEFTGDEPDTYYCLNCKDPVNINDPRCSMCEEELNWAGIS